MNDQAYRRYRCRYCGHIYDEAAGSPEDGIPAGTRWNDLSDDWLCPDCGQGKEGFRLLEQ